MTIEEIEQAVEQAIANAENVRNDRACTPKDHAEIDAEIAAIEQLGTFAKAALSIVDALADGEVYHDSKGGMLIVAKPDELLGKAKSLANK